MNHPSFRFAGMISACLILLVSCQKEISFTAPPPNTVIEQENQRLEAAITNATASTWLNGSVLNEQGQPIAGAMVSCGGKTVTTDSKGFFFFKEVLSVNRDYALITVTKTGYMNGFRTFTPNKDKLSYQSEKIVLQQAATPQVVPSSGGTVFADNIKLTFPANAIVRPGGTPYNGDVKVIMRYIDPEATNFAYMIPGMLAALNDANEIRALQSFGMANVELQDISGNELEIASGKTVNMEMPASSAGPATIPLWHFNEKFGIWIQQGTATKNGNVYVAEVNHFSFWNLDVEFNSFQLKLKFLTQTGASISGLNVVVYAHSGIYYAVKAISTDNNGEAILINCPSTGTIKLDVMFECDSLTFNIPPVTQSRTETIVLNGSNTHVYDIAGTLVTCNNQPLPNQPFQLFLSNPTNYYYLTGITDNQGNFSIHTVSANCQPPALTALTTAYINNAYRYSSYSPIVPGNNSYSPVLCDTSAGNGQPYSDSTEVIIPDPVLQQSVRLAINLPSGPIRYAHVKSIEVFDVGYQQIQSIIGLQYFTSLSNLGLGYTSVTDLTPLQALINLDTIDLRRTGVANLGPLANLINLRLLFLNENQIADISPLQNLTALKNVALSKNLINDLTPLQGLTQLVRLSLDSNDITNITPLRPLVNITDLKLDHNQIVDLAPLEDMTVLKHLFVNNNQITTIQPLINKVPALELFQLLTGNNVPVPERTAFMASHPNCNLY